MPDASPTLSTMIVEVEQSHPDGDPLDLLEEAVTVAGALTEVADHLIGHFVDNARAQGLSWTQIGMRLGVSKQAVRKRFAPDDVPATPPDTDADANADAKQKAFGRYTPAAQHVIVLARGTARHRRHDAIGTGHILLGVCHERSGLGRHVLEAAGLTVDAVESAVTARLGGATARPVAGPPVEQIPFDEAAKKALELTLRAALRLGHDRVGPGHLLLGLLAQHTGTAAAALAELGLAVPVLEAEVVRLGAEGVSVPGI